MEKTKTFYYQLDENKRLVWIDEVERIEGSPTIELESIEDIQPFYDTIEDGKVLRVQELEYDETPDYAGELTIIQQWLKENDWIPNKIVTGEWKTTDKRWQSYLKERTAKRARQDELLNALGGEVNG